MTDTIQQTSRLAALKARAAGFQKNDDGTVALIFGLCILPFCMFAALSVDYGRAVHQRQKFSAAIDSATVAAAKLVKDGQLNDDEIKARAFAFFKENVKGTFATYNDDQFDVQIDRNASRVEIKLPVSVPTALARIGGFEKMNIPQAATAVFQVRDIEVGMALDVTGSMNDSPASGGRKKIDSLKSAFEKFADQMLPARPVPGQKVRIGLAPYAATVNLHRFATTASGGVSSTCVVERDSAARFTDAAPGGVDVFRPGPADKCVDERLLPMTSDRSELLNTVRSFVPGGSTAGHLGAQWAWNIISPEWASVWGGASAGVPYGDKKTVKAVILMTDGQFNTQYYTGLSSKQQAIQTCENMKAKGVQVFTLGFGLGNTALERDAKDTLAQCATPGPDYFVDAADEAQLDAAFAKFAQKINALRISN